MFLCMLNASFILLWLPGFLLRTHRDPPGSPADQGRLWFQAFSSFAMPGLAGLFFCWPVPRPLGIWGWCCSFILESARPSKCFFSLSLLQSPTILTLNLFAVSRICGMFCLRSSGALGISAGELSAAGLSGSLAGSSLSSVHPLREPLGLFSLSSAGI